MKTQVRCVLTTVLVLCSGLAEAEPPVRARLVSVKKIWDAAPHNAFTDLVRWRDRWYCAFREGKGHAGDIGKLRILTSSDGREWESAALLSMKDYDLRDAAITVTPDDRLYVIGGAQQPGVGTGTCVSFSEDGKQFSSPELVIPVGRWLWRVTWHGDTAYGVTYGTPDGKPASSLLSTRDGRTFETRAAELLAEGGWPTEARVRFADDGTGYCLHRRDGQQNTAYLGTAEPPYNDWQWKDLGVRFGGPNLLRTPSGHWIGCGRLYDGGQRTAVTYVDVEQGTMTPLLNLPSGGDTSYPGMVWHDGLLWISYYASHEGKTSIYLAKLAIEERVRPATAPLNIGSRRELFVDDALLAEQSGAALQLHRPNDMGSVLRFDRPWEGAFCGYATVILDGDRYRLYYRGLPEAGKDGTADEATCYAESPDGIHWEKPLLDLYPVDGASRTNIILAGHHPANHNFSPFLDRNPAADPQARFKAIGGTANSGLIGFQSADGIRWTRIRQEPIFRQSGWVFDSQNVAFWSEHEQQYVLYFRSVPDRVRAIARTTSKDFLEWSEPELMTYSDTGTGQPSHHLYTNQTHPYFRAPHIYLSTAARFMPGRQVLNEAQAHEVGVHPSYFGDTSDGVLMSSRGGNRYDRTFLTALIRPGIGAENWVSRTNYPALNIVPTSDTEMSLYVCHNYGQSTSHLRRYVMRTDGLASLTGPYAGGEATTVPLKFAGSALGLNFATSAAGAIRIEIQGEDGTPIEGYALDDCPPIIGNEIDRAVLWESGSDIVRLAGRTIRLRIELVDAELYSFQFR